MTSEEKEISFMNRYFVFRKIHNVNASKVGKVVREEEAEPEPEVASIKQVLVVRKTEHMVILDNFVPPEPEGPPPSEPFVPPEPEGPPPLEPVKPAEEKKERCKKGTRRVGNDCLTPKQIEALKKNKTRKLV